MLPAAPVGARARRVVAAMLLLTALLALAACGGASPDSDAAEAGSRPAAATPSGGETTFEQVIADTDGAVVRVLVDSCLGAGSGTGFKVDDRLVATAAHVVDGAQSIMLEDRSGSLTRADVIGFDRDEDLALLRVPGPLPGPVLRFRTDGGVRLGADVVALGFPLDLPLTSTRGTVSGLDREIPVEDQTLYGLIQTDAAVNPGNSGGPLIDRSGDVVAVVVAGGVMAEGIGFGVPASDVRRAIAGWRESPDASRLFDTCVSEHDDSFYDEPSYEDAYPEEPEDTDPGDGDLYDEDPQTAPAAYGPSPEDVMLEHWEAIASGDYERAFSLFVPSYRAANSSWIDVKLATEPNVDLASLEASSIDEGVDSASVYLDLVAADTLGADAGVCRNFVGQVNLRLVDGAWLYEPGKTLSSVPIDQADARCLRVR